MRPTIVQATAGSGKTGYLARVATELVSQGIFPIACTYLNSMRDQLADRVPAFVRVSTLHSLAGHVVNAYGQEFTEPKKDEPWSEPYRRVLVTAAKLVTANPDEIEPLVQQHEWLLLDEAQDMTLELFQFTKALGLAGIQLVVVGDEDQSIFEFSGGSPQYMGMLRDEFGLHDEVLDRNYRCEQAVVDLANMYTGKTAVSAKDGTAVVRVIGPVNKWDAYRGTLGLPEDCVVLSFWRYCFPSTGMWNADVHNTVHSYKGSEAANIHLIWDPDAIRRLCQGNIGLARRLINVAITRTRGNLTIVCLKGSTALEGPLQKYRVYEG